MKRLYLIPLPAIIIGSLAMYMNGVSTIIWSQNIFASLIAVILSDLISRKTKIIGSIFSIPFVILLLLFAFFDLGLEGVHRWVSIGPIRFYIASIVLPILIIGLWKITKRFNWWIPTIITMGVSLLLALQPDASQSTAFIIPMAIILFNKASKSRYRLSVSFLFSLIIILSWLYLDNLPPVPYVEEIVKMVANMGVVWFVFGITSLVILPLPFFLFPPKNAKLPAKCLGLYFAIILISTLFGNFPVPIMGYGTSPIIGYFVAIAWLINAEPNS
ncbi:hypothetical protein Desdi_0711 [Desulfitobacterium dichloroeliminans LMG P-21439]|uniref:Bacterial cell division membrane protein n=1 Tax=Desulfitobacterium dichloroeliminans (strain LMG P-21439 / DCA1) TaxID=871963 RepID=L0F5L1_DESDL|nr:cell division protein [Desulfitobacterium dichloroeliminans]AGA68238.1 hypothetical protein Desdi_0711 [Desulfitobacterium dichloroeliminans LMG P-21439]